MYGMLVPAGGGEPLQLMKTTLVIGRHPGCDLVIASRSVSGQHCRLDLVDGIWHIRDLDSRNGTGVNGHRCQFARILPGQTLNIARGRFQIEYIASTSGAPSADDDLAFELLQSDSQDAIAQQATQSVQSRTRETAGPSSPAPRQCPVPTSRILPFHAQPVTGGPLGMLLPSAGGEPYPLHATDLIVGRSRQCDVRINLPTVSGQHCRLQLVDGYWAAEDLGSRNGIRIDGIRWHRKCLLPGAELSLSRESFVLDYTVGSGVPPAVDEAYFKDTAGSRAPTGSLLDRAGVSSRDVKSIGSDPEEAPTRKIYSLTDEQE